MSPIRRDTLAVALDALVDEFDGPARVPHDPLGVIREWDRSEWEVVAHIVAPLSYGSVRQLTRACRRVLAAIGPSPSEWVRTCRPGDFERLEPDFVYRMSPAHAVDAYLAALGEILRAHGTLEAAFAAGDDGGSIRGPLGAYVTKIRDAMTTDSRGARYLTPHPKTGSACKRWHLLLRWLARPDDGVDLGVWSLDPARLLLPLDTHTARLARWLGLSNRSTVDWRMAEEASARLRVCHAGDPMRYDMPLCHLGISQECRHAYAAEVCSSCTLNGICSWTIGQNDRA